jgi:integrase
MPAQVRGQAQLRRRRRGCRRPGAVRRLRSRTLQEPQIERRKYQDNPDVNDQPTPEVVPEEQDVYADHDAYHREHVKRGGYPVSHRFILASTMLRHTFVTTMLDVGVDLRDVQTAARPADPRTTMRYDQARKNLNRLTYATFSLNDQAGRTNSIKARINRIRYRREGSAYTPGPCLSQWQAIV